MSHEELCETGNTRSFMVAYIRKHFGDVLGPYVALLDQPGGLDKLSAMLQSGRIQPSKPRAA